MIGPSEFVMDYVVLPFRQKRLGEKFLVTTETGSWAILDKEQIGLLRAHRVGRSPSLFASLEASGIIVTIPNFSKAKKRVQDRFWYIGNGTSLQVVAVTNNCNFNCRYCYAATKDRKNMSAETAEKVADFIMQSPAKTIVVEFSGGEPLMNFDAIETIVEKSKELALEKKKTAKFAMIHNGSMWDEEKMEFFIKNRIGVCFSLDGPEDLHNLHRPYKAGGGTHGDVAKWIRRFRERGHKSMNALPVITRHSLPRWKEIVDEYLSHGFRVIRFKYLGYFGRAPDLWSELGYAPDEYLEAWKNVMEYLFELNNRGIFVVEGLARVLAKKLFLLEDPGYCELQMPCGAAISQLAYSPDGSVYTCDEGRMFEEFRMGSVDQTYADVMKSNLLKRLVTASSGVFNKCDSCAFKPFCGVCPIESYNMTGSIDVKVPLDRRCEMHMKMLEYLFLRISEDRKFKAMLENWAKFGGRKTFFGVGDYARIF